MNPEFLSFLNIIGMSESDPSYEELQDFYFRQKEKSARRSSTDPRGTLKWLIRSWVTRSRLEESDWFRTFVIRSLFVEGLTFPEISHILGLSETKVRTLAWDALLEEASPSSFYDRGSRDCARNDLYLIDVLCNRAWKDPLHIFSKDQFNMHRTSCERCRSLFERAQAYQARLKFQKLEQLPLWIHEPSTASSQSDPADAWGRASLPQILVKFSMGSGLLILLFLVVIAIPYWRSLLPKEQIALVDNRKESIQEPPLEPQLVSEPPAPADPEPLKSPAPPFVPPQVPLILATQTPQPKVERVEAPKKAPESKVSKSPPVEKMQSRVFFRWGARAQDPDRISESVLRLLAEVEAQNAGELALGAVYRGGRYFHFVVSKVHYKNLLSEMKQLDISDFSDTAAEGDRSIPEDQSRVVLWIGPTQ